MKMDAKRVETPALDARRAKLAPRPVNDVLTEFWDWLESEKIVLARYGRAYERSVKCPDCRGRGTDTSKMTPRERQLMIAGHLDRDDWPKCERCNGEKIIYEDVVDENSLRPIHESPTRLFAKFLDIDLKATDEEQRVLLMVLQGDLPEGYELTPDGTVRKVTI